MNKILVSIFITVFAISANGQTIPANVPTTQPFGKIDKADLELKACDFEKDANAEILFDKCTMVDEGRLSIQRHTRIKIFNEFGKKEANIRLIFYTNTLLTGSQIDLQAETINLENDKVIFTPLDRKLVYTEKINKYFSAVTFSFPDIKPGSVIEYKYSDENSGLTWYFQNYLPTRYSEIQTDFPSNFEFRYVPHVNQLFVKNVGGSTDYKQVKALANIHSLPDEPYSGAPSDNRQRMEFLGRITGLNSWEKIGDILLHSNDFGLDADRSISGEDVIIKQAKSLKSADSKIAFIFDTVRNAMKWNQITMFYTTDGIVRAWDKKAGNSTEINLILYRLLKKAGIKAYPLLISTKKNGKINPANPNVNLINNSVVYIPVDSAKCYVLDATGKYNLFNTIPADQLNTFGLSIDEDTRQHKMVFLEDREPAMQSVFLNAEVKPEGKIEGSAEITSYSYNKISALTKYKTDGEKKYTDYLCGGNNNLKISSVKFENAATDSLPLTQKIDYNIDLTGSDENYIYFNTNLFSLIGDNPFTKEERYSDIDFGYRDNYSINGLYKLPAGYKTDALPKNVTIVMPGQSIIFKRLVVEDNGTVLVKFTLNHKKAIYFRDEYQDIRGFYKKMYELLNEQIVLKKI